MPSLYRPRRIDLTGIASQPLLLDPPLIVPSRLRLAFGDLQLAITCICVCGVPVLAFVGFAHYVATH